MLGSLFTLAVAAVAGVSASSLSVRDDNSTDFSDFKLDSRLHRSFWGMAYTPQNSSNYPTCGDTIEEVAHDMQLLSQLTTRIRSYGADCGQTDLVLDAIQRTKTNLHVYVGIYLDGTDEVFQRQQTALFAALDKYGVDNILGITVGNEYILGQFNDNPANHDTAEQYVIARIADVRKILASKNYSKTLPVGTADAGSQITSTLSQAADYVMANTHAFFSGITIDGAADWTAQFLVNDEPKAATEAGKTLISAEVGWPSDAISGGSLTLNGSIASLENTQKFIDTFVCAANTNITNKDPTGVGYFFFELFDEDWKRSFGGAEPFWGLFDSSRNLKSLNLPDCEAPGETALAGTGPSQNSNSSSSSGSGNDSSAGFRSVGSVTGSAWLVAGVTLLGGALFL